MNTKTLFLLAGLALSTGASGYAADSTSTPGSGPVTVNFDHPENFKDVKDTFAGDAASSSYLRQFTDYLDTHAPRFLAEGQKLNITFTDIDMAGEFEPWRGPRAQDVRIVKDIYMPRLKFDYQVKDASGAVVKQGHANLTNLNFQTELFTGINRDDPLRYEKVLLHNWMQSELGKDSKK